MFKKQISFFIVVLQIFSLNAFDYENNISFNQRTWWRTTKWPKQICKPCKRHVECLSYPWMGCIKGMFDVNKNVSTVATFPSDYNNNQG